MTSAKSKPSCHGNTRKAASGAGETSPDDTGVDNGVLFWINKGGFPINTDTWERMWEHVHKLNDDGCRLLEKVRNDNILPEVSPPQPPTNFPSAMPIGTRIDYIQKYINALQYNHTGTQFYEIRKSRPIAGLMDVAKDMIREALPIKCLEAVILGIYLTNGMAGVERFPFSFKTCFGSNVHRHVVLGIYCGGLYGALGMSRRKQLMYKPLVFKSLFDLINDFEMAYQQFHHTIQKIKVGLPVSHDAHSHETISWKTLVLSRCKMTDKELSKDLERYSREIRSHAKSAPAPAQKMPPPSSLYSTRDPSPCRARSSSVSNCKATRKRSAEKKSGSKANITDYQVRI